jgi:hypothetical protein
MRAYGFEQGNVGSMLFKNAHEERNPRTGARCSSFNSWSRYFARIGVVSGNEVTSVV